MNIQNPAAPYYADVADGPDGSAYWLAASDSCRVRMVSWPHDEAKGTVFIFPGRTEYCEKYGRFARDLAELGYGSLAIDWRGQGIADRLHKDRGAGHVSEFIDYQKDAAAVIAKAEELELPKPWFLLAHSMGGCIGLRTLMSEHPFEKAMFSAPMWGILFSPLVKPFASTIAALSRKLKLSDSFAPGTNGESYFITGTFEENLLTTTRDMYDYMSEQVGTYPDLVLGGPTMHWLGEALTEMRQLATMPSPDLPCLTFLGTDEAIVDPESIRDRMAQWSGGELVTLDGRKHEVIMESQEKLQDVLGPIKAFLP